ncbi:MAG: cyclic nucleotide-binding domain-containing protein [Deltaproteobacteria bacterium]|nr:cyclic nucleotide-binding domain-containing protein [Deltaproteobacteria bacterium]
MVTGGLLSKFQGSQGKRRLIDSLRAQRLVREEDVAQALANCVRLEEVPYGATIITQGSSDHDLVFILAGVFFITVGRQVVSRRTAGEHIGEMAVVDGEAPRSATVTSGSEAVIARISEPEFLAIADRFRFPSLWRRIAQELGGRLRRVTRMRRNGRLTDYAA